MATTMTKAKQTEQTEADATEQKVPEAPLIKPTAVTLNDAGAVWRNVLVRASERMVADDFRSPSVWRLVQGSPHHALIKGDELRIVAHDETWLIQAICHHATAKEAHLRILKVSPFAEPRAQMFRDDLYEVCWTGSNYAVRRRSDGVLVADYCQTEGLAVDALRRQYPQTRMG